ncbi:FAD binding domain-containing protein [Virgibacillus halophilus]|uniref:FAD binding domain-containing protein n=1 Tax=Tigheibacillus halophilus TaxID=361280 RepID=A0ABU5C883_9BACI|nr:FAD binding domain-containing protein [Virgibacillus halophilus]
MKSAGFEYYRAHTISEAIEMFAMLESEGKSPLFFNGGTEIITMRRINVRYTDARAVIDIKGIPECAYTGFQRDRFVIGASVSLARLEETIAFPLLAKNSSRIADHTSREKITIGGEYLWEYPVQRGSAAVIVNGLRAYDRKQIRRGYSADPSSI